MEGYGNLLDMGVLVLQRRVPAPGHVIMTPVDTAVFELVNTEKGMKSMLRSPQPS